VTGSPHSDLDGLLADAEGAGAVGGEVAAGVGRVDALDEQVLAVEVRGGEAPADGAVVAEDDAAGEPGEVAPRMSKPGPTRRARYQVPGKVSAEMRVVGEQRPCRTRRMRA
jgi:hypothetical protein